MIFWIFSSISCSGQAHQETRRAAHTSESKRSGNNNQTKHSMSTARFTLMSSMEMNPD